MTVPANTALRRLALSVLAQYAGPAAGAEGVAAAAGRAYDDLVRVATPLIGRLGVESLMGRALHLARREYPWLVDQPERGHAERSFAQVTYCLTQQDPASAADAASAIFATFTGLLDSFIGEPLTASLLRKAWPDAFDGSITTETRA
jgi:hypothetical protein